ncbi:tRNA (adenosine(37)-N6)-threonylcarbamoyltransferase complex dimerization subunit type 1 TsaB [bacterium]|nr:tRNA (adenosine(37)-N6)-threonylcarbamoyltransferase complex dimerization subunit type 1 TsaB [candidate division CSSED10-310 bacterium]
MKGLNLVAIETSTKNGGVALFVGGQLSQTCHFSAEMPASETLIPSIKWMLEQQKLMLSDIDKFAVSIGPGSFTGLRVGLTAAKMLAFLNKRPLVTLRTLDVLVAPIACSSRMIGGVLDARKGEVYASLYQGGDRLELIEDIRVCTIEDFLKGKQDLFLIGDGIQRYRDRIDACNIQGLTFSPQNLWIPQPEWVGNLALEGNYPEYSQEKLFPLVPLYVRKSEAEIQWERRYGSV